MACTGPGLGADLLSHEATFLEAEAGKAEVATHSTAGMAGAFAAQLGARHLVLTHFSARYGPGRPRCSSNVAVTPIFQPLPGS